MWLTYVAGLLCTAVQVVHCFRAAHLRDLFHFIDLYIPYDSFLQMVIECLVPRKSGYCDQFLTGGASVLRKGCVSLPRGGVLHVSVIPLIRIKRDGV